MLSRHCFKKNLDKKKNKLNLLHLFILKKKQFKCMSVPGSINLLVIKGYSMYSRNSNQGSRVYLNRWAAPLHIFRFKKKNVVLLIKINILSQVVLLFDQLHNMTETHILYMNYYFRLARNWASPFILDIPFTFNFRGGKETDEIQ